MSDRAIFWFSAFRRWMATNLPAGLKLEIGCPQACLAPEMESQEKNPGSGVPIPPRSLHDAEHPSVTGRRLFMRQRGWLPRTVEKVGGARKNAAH